MPISPEIPSCGYIDEGEAVVIVLDTFPQLVIVARIRADTKIVSVGGEYLISPIDADDVDVTNDKAVVSDSGRIHYG